MNEDRAFSHVIKDRPSMVDIGEKNHTKREAVAQANLLCPPWLTKRLLEQDLLVKKGPVFSTAIIAGTMAAKNTSSLIPLCHTIITQHINIDITIPTPGLINIDCLVKSFGPTGVEMEALTGVSVAALTIYDMCKALTFDMTIGDIKLLSKTGGKSDLHQSE